MITRNFTLLFIFIVLTCGASLAETIKEKRDDPKRPKFGQVVEACEIINQNKKVACYSEHILLVEKKI